MHNPVLLEIIEKSKKSSGMYTQYVYKSILRNLINEFNNIYYIDKNKNSVKVKCFHANQERAIAKGSVGDNITLPVITVGEVSTENDDERRRYTPMLVHEKEWDESKQRATRVLTLVPRPVNINYTVNIWSKYKEDMDQIRENIFVLFNPDLEINLKYSNASKCYIVSEADSSEITADDTQDRIIKKTINIVVETYIPNPRFLYTSTGKIEELNFEFEINDK